jgi:hypothetical protein
VKSQPVVEPRGKTGRPFPDGQHQGREERRVGRPQIDKGGVAAGNLLTPQLVEIIIGVVGDEAAWTKEQHRHHPKGDEEHEQRQKAGVGAPEFTQRGRQ